MLQVIMGLPQVPDWAERIKEARQRANLTQRQLGEQIRRSQQTIDGYESGGRRPDVALYEEIARVCGVEAAWLIFGECPCARRAPSDEQSLPGIIAEAQKQSHHFAWAFQQAAAFLSEESVNADFAYVLAYTQKLLGLIYSNPDDARARETILRAIELDRQELRRNLEETKNRLL